MQNLIYLTFSYLSKKYNYFLNNLLYKFAKFEPAINPSKIIKTIIKLSKLYFLVFVGLDFSFTLLFC